MTPTQAALQLTKAWRATRAESVWLPVNCRELAAGLGIKVHGESMGDGFEGGLFIEDGLKAILYNEDIRQEGRKNFTISHELGHYSLHKDKDELRCSMDDLNNFSTAPHPEDIEQQANQFAAKLLMPVDDFREYTKRKRLTLGMLGELADNRYRTTLTATTIRLLELTSEPVAMVCSKDGRVAWARRSNRMKQTGFWLRTGEQLAVEALAGNRVGQFVDTSLWLPERHADRWLITQSTIVMRSYNQTIMLLHAIPNEESSDWRDRLDDDRTELDGILPWPSKSCRK